MISLSLKFRIKYGNKQNFKCIFLSFGRIIWFSKRLVPFFTSKLKYLLFFLLGRIFKKSKLRVGSTYRPLHL